MPVTKDFDTDNNHLAGICTGMSVSWAKFCLRKGRAPRNKEEMGGAGTFAAELGQLKYLRTNVLDTEVGFASLLSGKSMTELGRKTRASKWFTTKRGRFKNAAQDVLHHPGVYLICTSDHTMGACYFRGGTLIFLDPNEGQFSFDKASEFPSFYWSQVSKMGYDLSESILIKLGKA